MKAHMEIIPVYVVTGFLSSGKTAFLNHLLNLPDWRRVNLQVFQFETGEQDFSCVHTHCRTMSFSKRMLEQQFNEVAAQVTASLQSQTPDEIWVEWNGTAPLSQLRALLQQPELQAKCRLQKILFLASAKTIETLLGRTGTILPEQLAEADLAVLNDASSTEQYRRIRRLLRGVNPWLPVCRITSYDAFYREWFDREERPMDLTFAFAAAGVILYLAARPVFLKYQLPFDAVINAYLGILMQAVPFLLIGVLLSAAVQVFLPPAVVERWLSKSTGVSMLTALAAGFCFPVCDCASVPFFKGLLQKGVPLPAAVTFLLAAPIINPAAILSTYFAFGGNPQMVISRICCGILIALLVGLSFALRTPQEQVLKQNAAMLLTCGVYTNDAQGSRTLQKVRLLLEHASRDFFSVGKFLLIGAFLSAVFQSAGTGALTLLGSQSGLVGSILLMMLTAFCLSLCSSSDAVVARSFSNGLPGSAVLAFLVFGPMLDVKNLLMLSSVCSKRFLVRLSLTVAVLCFCLTFLLGTLKGGIL